MQPVIAEIQAALAAEAPLRAPNGDLPASDRQVVELAAVQVAKVRRCTWWCETFGYLDEDTGEPKPAARHLDTATRRAQQLLEQLGMTPAARAKIGVDIVRTVDLARAMSEKDPAKRAELMAEAGVPLDT